MGILAYTDMVNDLGADDIELFTLLTPELNSFSAPMYPIGLPRVPVLNHNPI